MTVANILSEKGNSVETAKPNDKLSQIAQILASKRIGAVVVVDKGQVCGIASERDIVRQIASSGADALNSPVSSCMTHKVISCDEDYSIDQVMNLMSANKFRHLPVIHDGELRGIISIGDVVKRKIEQAERDAEDLKRYIAG